MLVLTSWNSHHTLPDLERELAQGHTTTDRLEEDNPLEGFGTYLSLTASPVLSLFHRNPPIGKSRTQQREGRACKSHRISETRTGIRGLKKKKKKTGDSEWPPPQESKTDHLLHSLPRRGGSSKPGGWLRAYVRPLAAAPRCPQGVRSAGERSEGGPSPPHALPSLTGLGDHRPQNLSVGAGRGVLPRPPASRGRSSASRKHPGSAEGAGGRARGGSGI